MCKVKDGLLKDLELFTRYFGCLQKYIIATDEETVNVGDTVTLVNSNCEFDFDNVTGRFENNPLYYFIVDLELLDLDLSDFDVSKSNTGGCYGYAECRVKKVYEKSY